MRKIINYQRVNVRRSHCNLSAVNCLRYRRIQMSQIAIIQICWTSGPSVKRSTITRSSSFQATLSIWARFLSRRLFEGVTCSNMWMKAWRKQRTMKNSVAVAVDWSDATKILPFTPLKIQFTSNCLTCCVIFHHLWDVYSHITHGDLALFPVTIRFYSIWKPLGKQTTEEKHQPRWLKSNRCD